jgi:hypothetical protein
MRRAATTFARAKVAVCHWFNPTIAHQAYPQVKPGNGVTMATIAIGRRAAAVR